MKFCNKPFTYAYFGDKGEVWPCGWMHYTIGNLYEQDIDEIWHSEAADKARQSIRNGSFAFCRETSCPYCERGELLDLSEEEIARQAVPTELPLEVNIANDHICNIACTSCRKTIYCPEKGEREKIDGALKRFLPFANKLQTISMNGGGEFLANPSFIEFLKDLRPEREDFKLEFETNGILFDEEHWRKFSHLGRYHISVTVTLNSLRREVYRYLSGGFDHMERVKKNL